jgi:hypothetical protein
VNLIEIPSQQIAFGRERRIGEDLNHFPLFWLKKRRKKESFLFHFNLFFSGANPVKEFRFLTDKISLKFFNGAL